LCVWNVAEHPQARLKADVLASAKAKGTRARRQGRDLLGEYWEHNRSFAGGKFPFYFQKASMENEVRELVITPGSAAIRTLREIYVSMKLEHHFNGMR
jgi:hypothetical protein